jgi:uncharacterized Zn-finger protein
LTIKSRYEETHNGYIRLYLSDGRVIEEHRYVMEQHLGRKLLRNEVVHHIDENKKNNELTNLQLLTNSEHAKKHAKKVEDIKFVCPICKTEFSRRPNQVRHKLKTGQNKFYCSRSCSVKGQWLNKV